MIYGRFCYEMLLYLFNKSDVIASLAKNVFLKLPTSKWVFCLIVFDIKEHVYATRGVTFLQSADKRPKLVTKNINLQERPGHFNNAESDWLNAYVWVIKEHTFWQFIRILYLFLLLITEQF